MFLDTSGLLCLHPQPEPFHEEDRVRHNQGDNAIRA